MLIGMITLMLSLAVADASDSLVSQAIPARIAAVDGSGFELPGAVGRLCLSRSEGPPPCSRPLSTRVADRNGTLGLAIPPVGSYWLHMSLDGFYETWVGPISAAGSESWEWNEIELTIVLNADPAQTITVTTP